MNSSAPSRLHRRSLGRREFTPARRNESPVANWALWRARMASDRVALRGLTRRLFCGLAAVTIAATVLLLAPRAARAIDFNFLYTDVEGEGFFDPATGAQRRAAMEAAGMIIGNLIRPTYSGESVAVRVHSENDPASKTLAAATADFYYSNLDSTDDRNRPLTHYAKAVASHLSGQNVNPAQDDLHINVNFAKPFYFGTDGVVPDTQFDFVSTAAHEILHGLGFLGSFREEGGFGLSSDATYDDEEDQSGLPLAYDRYITVGATSNLHLLDLSSGGRASSLTSGNLYWNGPHGIFANGGSRPQLFAPNTYDEASTVGHLDSDAFPNDLMSPSAARGRYDLPPSAVVRGMLRDLGWDISITTSVVDFTAGGGNNRSSTFANWFYEPYPGDDLVFGNNAANVYDVKMDLQLYSHGEIAFTPTAPAYTLRFRSYLDTDLTAAGIVNGSVAAHTFVLETYQDDLANNAVVPAYLGRAATVNFRAFATAANTIFQVHGGFTELNQLPNVPPTYKRYNGAAVNFYSVSSAGSATFLVQGAAGDGATFTYARVNFHNNATANGATFNNQPGRMGVAIGPFGNSINVVGWGGRTVFQDASSAGLATFNNLGQDVAINNTGTAGLTNFFDASYAVSATFNNLGATVSRGFGGATQFFDASSAGDGTFNNNGGAAENGKGGGTHFNDNSSAGSGTFINNGGTHLYGDGGQTTFSDASTAGSATITNAAPTGVPGYAGKTVFFDSASAGSALITNMPSLDSRITTTDFYGASTAAGATIINLSGPSSTIAGTTTFHDFSSAGNGTFINDSATPGRGSFIFKDSSTAGQGTFTNGLFGGVITFHNNSTAGTANISLRGRSDTVMQFFDDTSAGAATIDIGRLTLGPTNESNDVQFYGRSTAANSTITARGDGGRVLFAGNFDPNGIPSTTAGNATIVALGSTRPGGIFSGAVPGTVQFHNWSTAGNATITAQGSTVADAPGGFILFHNGGRAGNATLIANGGASAENGGLIRFQSAGTGDSARLVVNAGAFADFSHNAFHGGTSVGSIEGAGKFSIGGSQLTVGNLNTNTTVSGNITDSGGFTTGVGGKLTKVGTGALTLSGANTYTGLTTVDEGTLVVNGSIAGGAVVKDGGILKGTGSMGSVVVETGGLFSPGLSPGTITVGGLNFMSGSTLAYELGAIARDRIVVTTSGNVTLGGVLDLFVLDGFNPALGQTFSLFEGAIGSITGAFSAVNAPTFNGHTLNVLYGANQVTLQVGEANFLAADFTEDGGVDGDDLGRWQGNFGAGAAHTKGDANGNGAVDGADFLIWQRQLGSGLATSTSKAVPEPSALALTILATGGWYRRRPRSVLKTCEQLIKA